MTEKQHNTTIEVLPPPVASESAALLAVIERAAQNPSVDVDKMERLLAMHERILDRRAKAAFTTSLAELQPKLPVVVEYGEIQNKSGGVQSTYAYWEDIIEAIRGLLSEHGFALAFRVGKDGEQISVTGILSHREGHSEETTLALPADISGNKNIVQAVGSSVSYGKRYTTQALLNITSKGEDDDGGKATGKNAANGWVAGAARGKNSSPTKNVPDHGELRGPLTITQLKKAMGDFADDLAAAVDIDQLNGLVSDNKALLDQCERDLPVWYYGKKGSDAKGIQERIADQVTALTAGTPHNAMMAG